MQHTDLINIFKSMAVEDTDLRHIAYIELIYVEISSPTLFNVYSKIIFTKTLDGKTEGLKIWRKTINTIKYADDIAILTNIVDDMQILINRIAIESEPWSVSINIRITKFRIILENNISSKKLYLNG